jgi:hypothetical protein
VEESNLQPSDSSFFQDLDFIEPNSLPGQVFRKFPDLPRCFRQQTGNTIYSFAARLSDGGTPVLLASRDKPAFRSNFEPVLIRSCYSLGMNELIFIVEDAPEGGFLARALGASIFTEADTIEELPGKVRDAVHCHFEEDKAPKVIRLHHVRDEVISL